MAPGLRHALFWTPRALCVLLAGFLAMFALDVFGGGQGALATALAFAIHLVPAALVLVALALAWRWEWIGAVLFAALGAVYALTIGRGHPDWIAAIAGPAWLVAALFLVGWVLRRSIRATG